MEQKDFRGAPAADEYNEFYATYVSKVPAGDVIDTLRRQLETAPQWLRGIPAEKVDYRYGEGKWSVKEVLGHMVDTEWIFTHRALWFARGDATPLPGMDQDVWMAGANFADRDLESLIREWTHLRTASLALFESFDGEIFDHRGTASGFPVSVRALLHIVAGHFSHHLQVLEERYL